MPKTIIEYRRAGDRIKIGDLLFIKRTRVYPISTKHKSLRGCLLSIPFGVAMKTVKSGQHVKIKIRGVEKV